MSFEQLVQELMEALLNVFGRDDNGNRQYMLVETFPDYLIARGPDGDLYQISYTVGADDDAITFSDPQEVETAYVPVAEAATFLAAVAGADPNSNVFPVEVMRAGFANGTVQYGGKPLRQFFPEEVVAQVAQAVNGARFGRRHPVGNENEGNQPELVAGWLENGHLDGNGKAALAEVHLLESEKDLQAKLAAARSANKLDLFGVSVLGYFGFQPKKIDGEDVLYATRLGKLARVDLVAEPAAGGRFLNELRVAASADVRAEISRMQRDAVKSVQNGRARAAGRQKGEAMKDRILKLLAAMRKHNAASADQLTVEFNGLSEDKHQDFLMKVTEAALTIEPASATAANSEVIELAKTALAEAKKIQSGNLVERKLKDAKLPKPAEDLVRTHLAERELTEAQVDTEITATRAAFAAYSTIGRPTGSAIVLGGADSVEKVQLAMDRLLRVKEAEKSGVAPFRGIRDAYVTITGDRELKFADGGFYRASEAIATGDFPNILLNSMTKKLEQDYAEVGMSGLDQIITKANINDFKSQDRVRLGYLGDLPTVAEAGPYTELTKPTDEKISYSVLKKGGILTISEETIRNDDLGKIAAFPTRLARAGRTL
ncbi:hypothetical protein Acid345_3410 [Candidatus Koribacter versatilis Ellin345]|uniref:Uncharacterized protein n=1 Tax=Koribacter versatilis (strain Ellin345) TaxID=204669 RepID=Q1IL39_KORVE|nr:hypothetical protein [Candidatus Koribacter versatilis]ABF42411.1 hypothetical protein Acid345_3410 [Candidatus Koribacter versatilis Ellin345]